MSNLISQKSNGTVQRF